MTKYEGDGKRALYIGDWKNGMRDGDGEEYNDKEELIRRGIWIEGDYDVTKRFENEYGRYLRVFDISWIKGVTRLVIGDDCFKNVNRFVIDGLNELKKVMIGKNNFRLIEGTEKGASV